MLFIETDFVSQTIEKKLDSRQVDHLFIVTIVAKIESQIWHCRVCADYYLSLFCLFFFCTVQKYIYKDYFSWQYSRCIASNLEI